MKTFSELKKNLKQDFSGLNSIKIAVLGDTATQFLVQAIKGYGYDEKISFDIYEAEYNQIERQIFDKSSELYKFKPEIIIIFQSSQKLLKKFYNTNELEKRSFANQQLEFVNDLYNNISSVLNSKIIYLNFNEINDSVFGNYANKTDLSFIYQLRKINFELMNFSQTYENFFISDLNLLYIQYGENFILNHAMYVNADLIFSIDFIPFIAKNIVDIIKAIKGNFKKCLILDLDNTIWGGIIGDDGLENIQIGNLGIGKAFSELQLWIKELKKRGIILAVCSKNNENISKEPFERHPDMILKIDDFAVFMANWNNKVDNVLYIQKTLNIGFDSMVFLDDNPFERNMVKNNIPGICVPELPEDPAEYLPFLRKQNLFEISSISEEDSQRNLQYQEEAQRSIVQKMFANEDDFLKNLEMESEVKEFDDFSIPRVSQLTQRSNQFNLRTIRYTDDDIKRIAGSDDYFTLSFNLKDKFGNYGLISVIILEKQNDSLFIDTWIMSCRVLKRGMEQFVLDCIINFAVEKRFKKLKGEYLPTNKNVIVKDLYSGFGFYQDNNHWILDIDKYKKNKFYIKNVQNE